METKPQLLTGPGRTCRAARTAAWLAVVLVAGLGGGAWAQRGPHLGYAYPAGGQCGTTVRVTVGGQYLRDPESVYMTGSGVSARVVQYVRALNEQELARTARFMREMVKRRWNVTTMAAARASDPEEPPLPNHPWLQDLDEKSPEELARLRALLFNPKRQPNAQIAEQVELEITIDPAAPPGARELRLLTAGGLTNPVAFHVGVLPEVQEVGFTEPGRAAPPAVDLPVVLNGQIRPGEADRFRLRARRGQELVVRVQARQLVPYLADAVPGWFQAVVTLRDPAGRAVAYADDYRFDPDPVLHYAVPGDGVYELEIRDSIYRGREDFVYRVTVGELPFLSSLFPLGGRAGEAVVATVTGWNLPVETLSLDTRPGPESRREVRWEPAPGLGNPVPYAVGGLPETAESEPNDAAEQAQLLTFPQTVNGRIAAVGDVDVFRFEGRSGEEVVIEVQARRLHSPLDAVLRLVDAAGQELAANDDHPDPELALLTHHADPYLRVKLPADGVYHVYLRDIQRHGGPEYAYRLHLRPLQPDFALRVTPSSLTLFARRPAAATVRAIREEGFEGDIDLALVQAPPGFTLNPTRLPAGKDEVQITISPPRGALAQCVPLRLEGTAQIGGAAVTRPVVPAEEMMQAFAYQHLVPQQALVAAVTGARPLPVVWRPLALGFGQPQPATLQIPLGGTVQVRIPAPAALPDRARTPLTEVQFRLLNYPRGLRLVGTQFVPDGVTLTFKADANTALAGDTGYLLLEVTGPPPSGAGSIASPTAERPSLGLLPALPFRLLPPR